MSEEPRRIQKGEMSYQPFKNGRVVRLPDNVELDILNKIDALQKSVDKLQSTVDGVVAKIHCI